MSLVNEECTTVRVPACSARVSNGSYTCVWGNPFTPEARATTWCYLESGRQRGNSLILGSLHLRRFRRYSGRYGDLLFSQQRRPSLCQLPRAARRLRLKLASKTFRRGVFLFSGFVLFLLGIPLQRLGGKVGGTHYNSCA